MIIYLVSILTSMSIAFAINRKLRPPRSITAIVQRLSPTERMKIAALSHAGAEVEAIILLRKAVPVDLASAKAVVEDLSRGIV